VATAQKRGGRYGYEWSIPMWWGSATEPRTLPLMVAHRLSRDPKFLAPQYTTCDYMLGGNPLNMTWMTGLGRALAARGVPPGLPARQDPRPGGGHPAARPLPLRPEKANGPWEPGYAQQVACYPDANSGRRTSCGSRTGCARPRTSSPSAPWRRPRPPTATCARTTDDPSEGSGRAVIGKTGIGRPERMGVAARRRAVATPTRAGVSCARRAR
jgi:hypothetical protein